MAPRNAGAGETHGPRGVARRVGLEEPRGARRNEEDAGIQVEQVPERVGERQERERDADDRGRVRRASRDADEEKGVASEAMPMRVAGAIVLWPGTPGPILVWS